jgi:hypothetical protein
MYGNDKNPKFLLKKDGDVWNSEDMFWDFIPCFRWQDRLAALSFRVENHTGRYRSIHTSNDCNSFEKTTYTERTDPSDQKGQIAVEDNKIKVQSDDDVGSSVPAAHNVDIVLAIPSNGAACNKDNNDKSSATTGSPTCGNYINVSKSYTTTLTSDELTYATDVKKTPIYQIAQAFKTFLRNNFEFARGVNVGLIPYSGKISIPPDKKAWAETIPAFVPTNFLGTAQNPSEAYIRGAFLYGTKGLANQNLENTYITNEIHATCDPKTSDNEVAHWGTYHDKFNENSTPLNEETMIASPLTGIMCRGKTSMEQTYGNNKMNIGDLLSTSDPATAYKFRRINVSPCYLGYANFLSMKCEKNCGVKHSWIGPAFGGANFCFSFYRSLPYFLIELQPDVGKVCDLLNVMGPFVDDYNVSNFLFIPITWANNLFQSWTNDPTCAAIDTAADGTGGRLSRPSKTTTGRKKALILVVNKPDWFEPQELTYIGFDNDYSEIPMIESDCIRFDINYSDTTRKFADGSAYDGTIQGAKKILQFTTTSGTVSRNADSGFYETNGTVTGKLTFPQKYLVKVVVEPIDAINWETIAPTTAIEDMGDKAPWGIATSPDGCMICISKGVIFSSDGTNWTCHNKFTEPDNYRGCAYGKGVYVVITFGGKVRTCTNGVWSDLYTVSSDTSGFENIYYDETKGKFITSNRNTGKIYSSADGQSWELVKTFPQVTNSTEYLYDLIENNGEYLGVNQLGYFYTSPDLDNWTLVSNSTLTQFFTSHGRLMSLFYRNGAYYVSSDGLPNTDKIARIAKSSDGGVNWRPVQLSLEKYARCIRYCDKFKKIVLTLPTERKLLLGEEVEGSIKFSNITASTTGGTTTDDYAITGRREFYIEPSQMNDDNEITFNMTNLRLVSAEITNRGYTTVTPTVELSGTTDALGKTNQTATITTNVKRPLTIKAKTLLPKVTFYNDNGVEDNVGTHNVIGSHSFNFSGATAPNGENWRTVSSTRGMNFGHNLSKYKVRYSLTNSSITNCVLRNQYIRDYVGAYGLKQSNYKRLILSDGTLANKNNTDYTYYIAGNGYIAGDRDNYDYPMTETGREVLKKFRDSCVVVVSSGNYFNSASHDECNYYRLGFNTTLGTNTPPLEVYIYGIISPFNLYTQGHYYRTSSMNTTSGWITKKTEPESLHLYWFAANWTETPADNLYVDLKFSFSSSSGWNFIQYFIGNSENKAFIPNITDDDVLYNRGVGLQNLSSDLSAMIKAGNYIVFQGDGELEVTVVGADINGTIDYVTPLAAAASTTLTNTEDQTFTISPESHKYEPQFDGTYKINLTLTNVQISDPQMVSSDTVFEYSKPRLPAASRVVDFSKKDITVSSSTSADSYADLMNYNMMSYDDVAGYWKTDTHTQITHHNFPFCEFRTNQIAGDFFCILEDTGTIAPQLRLFDKSGADTHSSLKCKIYNFTGTHRIFQNYSNIRNSDIASFDIPNAASGGNARFIFGGFSMPINTVLYYGANGNTNHHYEWQSDANGALNGKTPTEAAVEVTKSACAKLKSDWESNLRIYVVKYRKQTQYKHKVTAAGTKNFDYGYVDSCATNSSYVYDVAENYYKAGASENTSTATAEANLAKALEAIAADIKSWAGRTEAANVE